MACQSGEKICVLLGTAVLPCSYQERVFERIRLSRHPIGNGVAAGLVYRLHVPLSPRSIGKYRHLSVEILVYPAVELSCGVLERIAADSIIPHHPSKSASLTLLG